MCSGKCETREPIEDVDQLTVQGKRKEKEEEASPRGYFEPDFDSEAPAWLALLAAVLGLAPRLWW